MFYLRNIETVHFKNHPSSTFRFNKNIIGICGPNASGKTNLLDAIYILCLTKSHFNFQESTNVSFGKEGYRLSGQFSMGKKLIPVSAVLRETGRKEFTWDGISYSRGFNHIGKLPVVIIAPDDIEIILGGGEIRRKMVDGLLSQADSLYLQHLLQYAKLVKQRNALLKDPAVQFQLDTLDALDQQLPAHAGYIAQSRHQLLKGFLEIAEAYYRQIAGATKGVNLGYQACLQWDGNYQKNFSQALLQYRPKDIAAGRSLFGVHREDILLGINGNTFKQIASQGEKKSLLFALKLAEFAWLRKHKGFAPILLLDDVFEKLDNDRIANLLKEVCQNAEGQIFITDTDCERLSLQLTTIGIDYQIIQMS